AVVAVDQGGARIALVGDHELRARRRGARAADVGAPVLEGARPREEEHGGRQGQVARVVDVAPDGGGAAGEGAVVGDAVLLRREGGRAADLVVRPAGGDVVEHLRA